MCVRVLESQPRVGVCWNAVVVGFGKKQIWRILNHGLAANIVILDPGLILRIKQENRVCFWV